MVGDDSYRDDSGGSGRAQAKHNAKRARHCRVDGCNACLVREKKFYRRSRCCQMHARELQVMLGGEPRRFCQQCCGFHELSAFDGTKRSCRERLESHNSRQREKWTVGGRRRSSAKTVQGFSLPPKVEVETAAAAAMPDSPTSLRRASDGDADMANAIEIPSSFPGVEPDIGPPEPFSVSFEAVGRYSSAMPSPWEAAASMPMQTVIPPLAVPDTIPPRTHPVSDQAVIGGLAGGSALSGGGGGSPARPPRARRTMRSKSDKTGGWSSGSRKEAAYSWAASGAARHPRLPSFDIDEDVSAAGLFEGASGSANGGVPLYKHNSIDISDMQRRDEEAALAWSRPLSAPGPRGLLKRLSLDSAMRTVVYCEASEVSAASGSGCWPSGDSSPDAAAHRLKRRSQSATKALEMGLGDDDEARAFAAQAPDPLWLAQRLVGSGLRYRPEYSYGRDAGFARKSESTASRLADSLDAAVMGGQLDGLPSMPPALQLPHGDAPDDFMKPFGVGRGGGNAFGANAFQPAAAHAPPAAPHLPVSYRRRSASDRQGPRAPALTPAMLTELSLSPGWDTNESTLTNVVHGAATMEALMAEIREEPHIDAFPASPHIDGGWLAASVHGLEPMAPPHRRQRTNDDPSQEFDNMLPGGPGVPFPLPSLGPHSLAAMGRQRSAPPMGFGAF